MLARNIAGADAAAATPAAACAAAPAAVLALVVLLIRGGHSLPSLPLPPYLPILKDR